MSETSDQMEHFVREMSGQVLGELQKNIEPIVDLEWRDVQREIESQADTLKEENAHRVIDGPSGLFLHTCSLLLAGYRVILPLIEDRDKVLEIMAGAMGGRLREGIEAYIADRFEITQDSPEQAFEKMRVNLKKFGEAKFGRSFSYEQEDRSEKESTVNVRKCFFNEFFSENGATELTLPVFCKQDDIWMDELNKPKYGMKVNRSTILAEGDDACSFHLNKTD